MKSSYSLNVLKQSHSVGAGLTGVVRCTGEYFSSIAFAALFPQIWEKGIIKQPRCTRSCCIRFALHTAAVWTVEGTSSCFPAPFLTDSRSLPCHANRRIPFYLLFLPPMEDKERREERPQLPARLIDVNACFIFREKKLGHRVLCRLK